MFENLGHEAYDYRVRTTSPLAPWLTGNALRLHAILVVVACGCLAAGGFELSRALSGNRFSWVYVFEWPFFAGFSVVIWWRLLHEGDPAAPARSPETTPGAALRLTSTPDRDAVGYEQLRAWQDYLARLHAERRPG